MKHLLSITIALLPSAVFADQFTPQQMLRVMTKLPDNRDTRVHDAAVAMPVYSNGFGADRRNLFSAVDYD